MDTSKIILYQGADGGPQINVQLEQDTLWLTQDQIAQLFDRERSVITKHIKNIFLTAELEEKSNVQKMHIATSDKPVTYYSLDLILSVGYRVNSKRGTQFRQWANQVLKEYLVKGYTLNQQRLQGKLEQAQTYLQMLVEPLAKEVLTANEKEGLVDLLNRYAKTMALLSHFDEGSIGDSAHQAPIYILQTQDCLAMVAQLKADLIAKGEASTLFGNQKDDSFDGVIGAVNQTVFGEEAYPTVEAKAAHLLYFIIKNHPFSDGNKRIGAFLFAWYLERNQFHLQREGELKINENALTAIALLVALSDPKDKDQLLKLIMALVA